jgi:putative nucleotidyltransferase with HDIG domain
MNPLADVRTLSDRNQLLLTVLASSGADPTLRLARELERADDELLRHGAGVAELALLMAPRLGLADESLPGLCRAALLHDIGKRFVPNEVLGKPGALLAYERQLVEAHAGVGANMLVAAGLLSEASIVRHHHERWDGAGYPDRMHGDSIPLESRIILVADSFDAMTSDRAYRSAMRVDAALAEIELSAGTQLDPSCVSALREVKSLLPAA